MHCYGRSTGTFYLTNAPVVLQEETSRSILVFYSKKKSLCRNQQFKGKSKRSIELKNEQSRQTELALEYRSALISAAVTGQIDVRGMAEEVAA